MTADETDCMLGMQCEVTLNICTEKDLHDMMKEILPEFIKKVDPREDGFLDTLYASYLLTDTDNESLSGKDVLTRKDQARKLWFILNKIPLEDFMSKVAPELCKKYGHIIPKRFRQDKEQDDTKAKELVKKCLRHAIQSRIRATSMADMLYHKDFLDFEDYGDIISGTFETESVWLALFSAFCERSDQEVEALMEVLRSLLRRYNMKCPDEKSLKNIVSVGLPCTCDHPLATPPVAMFAAPVKKVGSWLRKSRFSLTRSSGTSSRTVMPESTSSPATARRYEGPTSVESCGTSRKDIGSEMNSGNRKEAVEIHIPGTGNAPLETAFNRTMMSRLRDTLSSNTCYLLTLVLLLYTAVLLHVIGTHIKFEALRGGFIAFLSIFQKNSTV